MQDEVALTIRNVYKDFKLPHERRNSLKELALNWRKKISYEKFHALRDINVDVKKGEFFGIVGRNGSGKSTLLKLIGGIYQPTAGEIIVNGTLTPFIELGIGFNPELTGRENVFLNGAILGLTRKEVEQKYNEIVAFSELEKFMDQKLKNYSSGMQVRLAFSIAIQAHNDILLIDEVLAVGDTNFQRKCFQTFRQIKDSGKTVIFVTHDMSIVQEFCDRAMMIQDSEVVEIGEPRKIALRYEAANSANSTKEDDGELRRPTKPAIRIEELTLKPSASKDANYTVDEDLVATINLSVRKPAEVQINLFFLNADGEYLAGVNSTHDLKQYTPAKGEHTLTCTIRSGQLIKGKYYMGLSVYTMDDVPDLIDVIDKNYGVDMPKFNIINTTGYQDGVFYIQGDWRARKKPVKP